LKESINSRMSSGTAGETIPGTWFPGGEPDVIKAGSYPILFIHGINTTSETWKAGGNDIGESARSSGFRTAFINLSGTADMWSNGLLLAENLKEIYAYFKKELVILAHSKGGIDAQTAIRYHGASQYVKRVITLSTPHHGSELADLAYSRWADWLTETLGSRSDAVFSLQTGYMRAYRNRTDAESDRQEQGIYTFGGTGWGSMSSELFWGGLYLSRFGASDGAVTVKSSRLPYAQEVMVDDWTHKTIKMGEEIFPYIEEMVFEEMKEGSHQTAPATALKELETSVLHRGGEYMGVVKEGFSVEEGVDEINVDWISCSGDASYVLTAPNGRKYTRFITTGDATGFFPNAFHHSVSIDSPSAGRWVLEARNDQQETYLLNVIFSGGVNVQLDKMMSDKKVDLKNNSLTLQSVSQVEKNVQVTHFPSGQQDKKSTVKQANHSPENLSAYGEGLHNMTIDLAGITVEGAKFERTLIKTIYVDQNGMIHE
jgi:pimeloyl-ACP methyl ester carboxylesterase